MSPTLNHFRKSVAFSLLGTLVLTCGYMAYEPGDAGAQTVTDTVIVTLNVTAGISITSPADTTMSTALGITQNSAVGTTTWNVKTNAAAGYTLAVKATSTPAMEHIGFGTSYLLDYQTGSPNTWLATSGFSYFGYSGYGTDIYTGDWGTGSVCSGATAHATSTTLKYKGFTTSNVTIATRAATTTPAGVDSTICYAAEQKNVFLPSGVYQATIIATATAL